MTLICIAGIAILMSVLIAPSIGLYVAGGLLAFLLVWLSAELLGKVP